MKIPESRSLHLSETLQMIEAQRRLHEQLEVSNTENFIAKE